MKMKYSLRWPPWKQASKPRCIKLSGELLKNSESNSEKELSLSFSSF